jgi:hypothetical protein
MFKPSEVKLPMYEGKRRHVLLLALDRCAELSMNQSDISRELHVRPQSLWVWKRKAEENRNFLLPAEQVLKLSWISGIPPYYFRPDLWPRVEWVL